MVQPKAKVTSAMDPAVADPLKRRTVGARRFKVYSDRERIKTDAGCNSRLSGTEHSMLVDIFIEEKSVPANGGTTQTSTDDHTNGRVGSMENAKVLYDSSVKTNLRRKALADVSNVRSNLSSKAICDGSKPMKYKSERRITLQRASLEPGTRLAGVSLVKPLTGKLKEKLIQGTGEPCATKRGPTDLNTTSGDRVTTTKGQCYGPISTVRRRTQIPTLALARKSLPTLQRNKQEISVSPAKGKEKTAIPTRVRVGNKLLPPVSNPWSRISRNRGSYGHIMMVTRNQTNGACASSRKATEKVGNNAVFVCTSQSKHVLDVDKSSSANKKEKVPLPEIVGSTVLQEDVKSEVPSSDTDHSCRNKSDIICKKKEGRRRSYTSSLMARSKLLEENGEVVQLEKVPSIDDSGNQLEVAEYVDEIYEYYWITEAQSSSLENYMSIQTDITPHMRGILINWLIEVHFKFDLMHETLYLMVTLLDRYLSQVTIEKNEMQLVGLTSLLLASKYEDFWHPRIKDLISISAQSYTREQMLQKESSILKQLRFRLNVATPYVFMLRFLKAAQSSDKKLEHLAFYLIELCLVHYEALPYKPSLLCASALYLARCTLKISPAWTLLLVRHARYDVPQMRECAEMILRFHKAARTAQLKVTYEKYMDPDRRNVATMQPLEKLPA